MKFSFGIITDGNNDDRINNFISTVEKQNIKDYEIIVVGPNSYNTKNTISLIFDDSYKKNWITKKKNLITSLASYENIVYTHDYFELCDDWYEGQIKAGENFDVRIDKIINIDQSRFRDWCIWPHNDNEIDNFIGTDCLIPYNITHLSKLMYISGGYFISKKKVMEEFPFDEDLLWGEGEDVAWSKQVREKYKFSINTNSTVKVAKYGKNKYFNEIPIEKLNKILSLFPLEV